MTEDKRELRDREAIVPGEGNEAEAIEAAELEEPEVEIEEPANPYFSRDNDDISFINRYEESGKKLYSFRFPNRHGALVCEEPTEGEPTYTIEQVIWREYMDYSDGVDWKPITVDDNIEGVDRLTSEGQVLTEDETIKILEKIKDFEKF